MSPISTKLRAKLDMQRLPTSVPLRARIVSREIFTCAACDLTSGDVRAWELQFPGGLTFHLHLQCERDWRAATKI